MTTVAVKICGVRTDDALDACIEAGADWVGFVFFARSPRWLTPLDAARLAARLPPATRPVGLFVSPTDTEVDRVLDIVPLSAIQLYDRPERVAALGDRTNRPIWHALPVAVRTDLPTATAAARLVVEGRAGGSDRPGGNGTGFDHTLLAGWHPPAPWVLAGGLTPANVAQAVRDTGARAVDVSSGVESAPGAKSPDAIRRFIGALRRPAEGRMEPRAGSF